MTNNFCSDFVLFFSSALLDQCYLFHSHDFVDFSRLISVCSVVPDSDGSLFICNSCIIG